MKAAASLAFGTLAAMATLAHGEEATPAQSLEAKKVQVFVKLKELAAVDLAIPDSPAFSVLGISPSEVQRPGTVRELGASLLRGVDANGKAKTGLALDVAPLPLFAPSWIRGGDKYKGHYVLQAFTRTTVSLATTADEKGGDASKLAWGVRMGVFDLGDPGEHYEALVACFKLTKPTDIPSGPNVNSVSADETKKAIDELNTCLAKRPQKPLWAEPALYVGFGRSWFSNSGKVTDRTPAVSAWWATYSQGLAKEDDSLRLLLQLHASRKTDDRVEDPNDATKLLRQDANLLVARFNAGRDEWRAFLDAGRRELKLAQMTTEKLRHIGLGAEFKLKGLGDNMWLQLGSVRETGYSDGKSVNKTTASLRFGSEPLFAIPGK
jgi:hypothetical protein